MNAEQIIEKHFNLSFIEVINSLHWKKEYSIKKLSDLCKISRDTFQRLSKRYNLKLRSLQNATKLTKNSGTSHWAYGKKRPECSERMKKNNPCFKNENLIKMAISKAKFLKDNPLPTEKIFLDCLMKHKIKHIFQYPINRYVIDFFFPSNNLCIEIESMDKWGKTKRNRAATKRTFLESKGYKVLNIPRLNINEEYILYTLYTHYIVE